MLNLIRCGTGNIGSVKNALNTIGCEPKIVEQPSEIEHKFKKIILPGVGSFDSFIKSLKKNKLFDEIKKLVLIDQFQILGICVGMQSFFKNSEEGTEEGLNILKGNLIKFDLKDKLKVPHMGWNNLKILNSKNLLSDLPKTKFYFAHSYHAVNVEKNNILSETEHGFSFPSCVNYKNIYGVQFHPEKSFFQGQKILKNFIDLC
jgi:glutamine amidotransferase